MEKNAFVIYKICLLWYKLLIKSENLCATGSVLRLLLSSSAASETYSGPLCLRALAMHNVIYETVYCRIQNQRLKSLNTDFCLSMINTCRYISDNIHQFLNHFLHAIYHTVSSNYWNLVKTQLVRPMMHGVCYDTRPSACMMFIATKMKCNEGIVHRLLICPLYESL